MAHPIGLSCAPLTAQQRLWRPLRAPPASRGLAWAPRRLAERATACDASADADGSPAAGSGEPATPLPPPPPGGSALDSIPPQKLKQLITAGLALKYVIKVGRQGASEGLAAQVRQRWNTSEVARLYCHGKHAANMKLLAAQLEAATGGIVVHRSGGTVFLYRGDDWGTAKARVAAAKAAAAAKQQQQPEAAAAGQEPPEQQPAAPHP